MSSAQQDILMVIIPTEVDYQVDSEDIDEDDFLPQNIPNGFPGETEWRRGLATIRQDLLSVQNKTITKELD